MTDKIPTRLVLDNVSHGFGPVAVLNQVNLSVAPGELVVIAGPSGCGKSTLLNIISGYVQPLSGTVERTGIVRTVYQQDGLFPWLTVSQNIAMGLRDILEEKQRIEELQELLSLIRMEGFENHYPHQLSGGMRQRVELARAIAGDSDILLMDEPFSSLDYQTRLLMRLELIALLNEKPRTVIFVTHDIEEAAQLGDRVLVLSKRPAYICKELRIDAQRPRDLADPSVISAVKTILDELGLQITKPVKG